MIGRLNLREKLEGNRLSKGNQYFVVEIDVKGEELGGADDAGFEIRFGIL